MKRDSKIYVAGHAGLVGSAFVRRLTSQGYTHVVTRPRNELDLTEQEAVRSFFESERPEYVFLAAARVGGILANETYPADFIRENLLIQTNVIDAAYRNGVKKLLFLGSSCIYPKHCPQPMKEEHLLTGPLESTNEPYAIAKIAGLKMCEAYRRQHGFQTVCLMPTNLYGPNDNFDLESSHVLPALIRKFHLAKLATEGRRAEIEADEHRCGLIPPDVRTALGLDESGIETRESPAVVLWGTGTPRREFLHADDLADAGVFLMTLPPDRLASHLPSPPSPCLMNVGTGEDITIQDLAEMVRGIVDFGGKIVWDETKPDGTPRKLLDVTRVKAAGWSPNIELRQGIAGTYRWYLEQLNS